MGELGVATRCAFQLIGLSIVFSSGIFWILYWNWKEKLHASYFVEWQGLDRHFKSPQNNMIIFQPNVISDI